MAQSGNPLLNPKRFPKHVSGGATMTADGAAEKAALMIAIVALVAAGSWWLASTGVLSQTALWLIAIVGAIAGLGIAIALAFKPEWSPILAPIYAVLEGFLVGAISLVAETMFPGIVLQAVGLTFAVALVMLGLYRTRIIKVTRGFWIGVLIATASIVVFSLVVWMLSLFGVTGPMDAIAGSGPVGIIFSIIVIIIATLNLAIDFAMIEEAAKAKYPQFFEWYCAFALTVTLVWLYIEILRLLIKLRSRD